MKPVKKPIKKPVKKKKSNKILYSVIGIAAALVVSVILLLSGQKGSDTAKAGNDTVPTANSPTAAAAQAEDIIIQKNEITETATFIPYKAGNTYMEVIAVKAPDGTIRTAFNTCQVCFDSGRGYYIQQGNVLVCQNCGNRFKISQVEKEKNGCNPVPILSSDKTENDSTITISGKFLNDYKVLFTDWKR